LIVAAEVIWRVRDRPGRWLSRYRRSLSHRQRSRLEPANRRRPRYVPPGSVIKPRRRFSGSTRCRSAPSTPRKAIPVAGGYRISGRTTFVSGAHHATAFLGFANICDDGELRLCVFEAFPQYSHHHSVRLHQRGQAAIGRTNHARTRTRVTVFPVLEHFPAWCSAPEHRRPKPERSARNADTGIRRQPFSAAMRRTKHTCRPTSIAIVDIKT